MDKLYKNISKLGEVSGDIALSLISDDFPVENNHHLLADSDLINHKVNQLEVMIRKLNRDFHFSYKHFRTIRQMKVAEEHNQYGVSFWMAYTIKACLNLSKWASSTVATGFQERNINRAHELYIELRAGISNVVFGIINLNEYGLNFKLDDIAINKGLERLDTIWVEGKGFVFQEATPVSPEQFPSWVFLYSGNNSELHEGESKITLPMENGSCTFLE